MGFTPLAGLPMGTRAGDIDAGIMEYLMNKYNMNITEMLNVLNKKSGMQGISGVSSDFRDLEEEAEKGNARCALARDKFAYETKKLIGAYAAIMGGVDAIIFTAGVGENDGLERAAIASGLEFMGIKLDAEANKRRGEELVISAPDSKVKILLDPYQRGADDRPGYRRSGQVDLFRSADKASPPRPMDAGAFFLRSRRLQGSQRFQRLLHMGAPWAVVKGL